ncbi:hypothetical protein PsorP6_002915 [Peronosclerospora sorghi]|uniref:Uncharacterized protein n=1 Tax=Peronosclerospora sorghi TaxID=230839 RepID=A0ACC0VIJ9_9STRA|nr:hypothetical protein PsorP6_002915 [Peronosclerospora sorghi]
MNKRDAVISEHFHLTVLQENEHAQLRISRPTVFFMPHCAHILYHNVLACNWGPALQHLLIIGNSSSAYTDRLHHTLDEQSPHLLVTVSPYVHEVPLSYAVASTDEAFARYHAAFHDLSLHAFPSTPVEHVLAPPHASPSCSSTQRSG